MKKILGPIGVAIAVVDFGLCMHRHGYMCVYVMITPVEKEYIKIKGNIAMITDTTKISN
ncbi:hypothetical protein [Xylanibacter oryzae]|uniref:hypothetical protein n=1 Tax=Xylanibacter oryzae TaxID=185293 RepID=UPI0004B4BD43|nr:hypothetical protein [Xylanibacter oryzae]